MDGLKGFLQSAAGILTQVVFSLIIMLTAFVLALVFGGGI